MLKFLLLSCAPRIGLLRRRSTLRCRGRVAPLKQLIYLNPSDRYLTLLARWCSCGLESMWLPVFRMPRHVGWLGAFPLQVRLCSVGDGSLKTNIKTAMKDHASPKENGSPTQRSTAQCAQQGGAHVSTEGLHSGTAPLRLWLLVGYKLCDTSHLGLS